MNALLANTVTAGLSQRQERLSTLRALARLSCPGPRVGHASELPSGTGNNISNSASTPNRTLHDSGFIIALQAFPSLLEDS